jgi:myo-inositol 2-dehydrogenase/D-chiro-inositol 1-dehydrogenase
MNVRLGILGCGRIGQIHARSAASSARTTLVAVADASADAAHALARATGAEVRAAEAILSASDIDAVVIGTPTDTHADFIENATALGKAVLCEKARRLVVRPHPVVSGERRADGDARNGRTEPPLRSRFR